MTISAVKRFDGVGNDATISFAYGFKIFAATHLQVAVREVSSGVETALTYPTHYSVSGVGLRTGGSVTLNAVSGAWQNADGTLKSGYVISGLRVVPVSQSTDIRNQGAFHADVHEDALDYLTMIDLQQEDAIARSVRLPASYDPDSYDLELPAPDAGMAIGWNDTEDGLVNLATLGAVAIPVPVASGGTGSNSASAARTALGLAIGTNVQAYDTELAALAALTSAADKVPYFTGSGAAALADFTSYARTLSALASKAAVQSELGITSPQPSVRQTVRSAALDSSGYSALLSAGAGLNFNVAATTTPAILDFAAGSADYTATLTANATNQGSLVASNTNFIYADYVSASSVTWANCLIPPQVGYAFDRAQAALLNFEGTNGDTTTKDDFGNTWTLTGATISTAVAKYGLSSLSMVGGGKYATCSNFTSFGDGSWEVSVWFYLNALPGVGAGETIFAGQNASGYGVTLILFNNAGTRKLRWYLSSTGASHDIANAADGTNTTWATATQYKARIVFDALAGTYRTYFSIAGAAESQDLTVSSSARICGIAQFRLGRDITATLGDFDGYMDAFRFIRAATVTGTETPAAVAPSITDHKVHFFSIPAMTMYEVTAASASAGTNPTLTARNRLFVGEQDTSGAAVTATRNSPIRGQYDSGLFSVAANNWYSKNHYLGSKYSIPVVTLVNETTDNGYTPGDEITVQSGYDTAAGANGFGMNMKKNSLDIGLSNTGIQQMSRSNPSTNFTLTLTSWKARVRVTRGF